MDFARLLEAVEEPKWLTSLRLTAYEQFMKMEWPTPKEEEWRRTDITGIDFASFKQPDFMRGKGIESRLRGKNQHEDDVPGISVKPLCRGSYGEGDSLRRILYGQMNSFDNRLIAWNCAMFDRGAYVVVPEGYQGEEVVYLTVFAEEGGYYTLPRIVVEARRNSRATVVVSFVDGSKSEGQSLVNGGIDVSVGEDARLKLYVIQNVSANTLFFGNGSMEVARGGHLESFESHFGGSLVKTRLTCSLDGEGSEAYLRGAYFPTGKQHMDIRTVQKHRSGHTNSRLFYKGAVKDSGRAVYQGLIEVFEGAEKTDAYLTDKNLILNDGARADSIPTLKIRNNDVRCSHGSTTGKINEDELYYLETRGIERREAERMLVAGFFNEVTGVTEVTEEAGTKGSADVAGKGVAAEVASLVESRI